MTQDEINAEVNRLLVLAQTCRRCSDIEYAQELEAEIAVLKEAQPEDAKTSTNSPSTPTLRS
jgi:hypothetical protein